MKRPARWYQPDPRLWHDALSRRIAETLAIELDVPTVNAEAGFSDSGGDSLSALATSLHVEKVFGVCIDPADLLEDEPVGNPVREIAMAARSTPDAARTVDDLREAIATIIDTFTPQHGANLFAAAGYHPDEIDSAPGLFRVRLQEATDQGVFARRGGTGEAGTHEAVDHAVCFALADIVPRSGRLRRILPCVVSDRINPGRVDPDRHGSRSSRAERKSPTPHGRAAARGRGTSLCRPSSVPGSWHAQYSSDSLGRDPYRNRL
ncbi:MAG: acyl carrier protein [Rhodospirillales bacterium]|nr:acyl carrier protein [Rhodospirillales bacterium]